MKADALDKRIPFIPHLIVAQPHGLPSRWIATPSSIWVRPPKPKSRTRHGAALVLHIRVISLATYNGVEKSHEFACTRVIPLEAAGDGFDVNIHRARRTTRIAPEHLAPLLVAADAAMAA